MLQSQTLRFLSQLKKHNDKTWFDAHRKDYETAKADFLNFIQSVIDVMQHKDAAISDISARNCLFRINRDIRFSKDKSPYKTNFGAFISKGGRKSPFAGYYFHCEPGNSFIGGGLWMPDTQSLKNVRQEIDYCWEDFSSILKEKKFKTVYGDLSKGQELSLTANPKGYDKDNPAIEYLKLKSFVTQLSVSDEQLTQASLHKKAVSAFEALMPLLQFINGALQQD